MRRFFPVLFLLALGGCAIESERGSQSDLPIIASLPQFVTGLPGEGPEFGVAGLEQKELPPGYDGFNNTAPDVIAQHAAQICTLGYEVTEQQPAPGSPVGFATARIRCNSYRPSF